MSDRERWAYEELQAGDVIQEGDQWLNPDGRWQAVVVSAGSTAEVWCARVRRPHNITMMLAAFANQAEVLAEVRADEKRLFDDLALLRSEYAKLQRERDESLAEVAKLSAALKTAQRARDELQLQADELRADRRDEPTARQVQQVLHRWATELEWSADCFGSATREQVHAVQNTLITVMQRIETMIDAENSRAND